MKPWNQDILPESFWNYFKKRVHRLSELPEQSHCGDTVIAFVVGGGLPVELMPEHEVNLCPSFYDKNKPLVEKVSVLMHEARHFDDHGYSHVVCQNYPGVGRKSCDESIEQKGGFAVSIEALLKMMDSGTLDEFNRAYAKQLILQYRGIYFNVPPEPLHQRSMAVFLKTTDGRGFIFDGVEFYQISGFVAHTLVSRFFSVSVYPNDLTDSFSADLFSKVGYPLPPFGSTSLKFNSLPLKERMPVVDIILQDSLEILAEQKRITVVGIGSLNVNWDVKKIFTTFDLGIEFASRVYAVDEKEAIHLIDWSKGYFEESRVDVLPGVLKKTAFLISFDKRRLSLSADGKLSFLSEDQKIQTIPSDLRFQSLTRPFLWDKDFR